MSKLRWGILSTAQIGRKNWKAIHSSANGIVGAVASRDVERSQKFIEKCQVDARFSPAPKPLGSYEELISSPDIDAVYIPLPTAIRKEWVLRAAAAGKHVLCEKPCGLTASDVEEMAAACRRHKVQFMDGVMFMHNPRLQRVREVLDDGQSVGQVRRIMSIFTFAGSGDFFKNNIRLRSDLEPTGCLGDLGWYCIRFTLWSLKWQMPREVTGRILSQRSVAGSPGPAPVEFSAEMYFDGGVSAAFYSAFIIPMEQWVNVSGTQGSLSVPDFVHVTASHEHEPVFDVNDSRRSVKCCDCVGEHNDSRAVSQETHMVRNFSQQVQSGRLNEDWPDFAVKTQRVLDACWESAKAGGRPVTCIR